jgi:class 3 adenylate cyclase/DNA-binding SARP family transcriptional activator
VVVLPTVGETQKQFPTPLFASLLGPFVVSLGDRRVVSWRRPPAKRLLELLLVSPGRRISRDAACTALFPHLRPEAAGRVLSQALSNARAALSALGEDAAALLQSDRTHIWANPAVALEVDADLHQKELRLALAVDPGMERDDLLVAALADEATLLEGEPLAEWALRPREQLEWARQEARLTLARARARGLGRSGQEAVVQAWEACLSHDSTSEEATCALMRLYAAQARPTLVEAIYSRCRAALEVLGLRTSPAVEDVHAASSYPASFQPGPPSVPGRAPRSPGGEHRIVTVLFIELSAPLGIGRRLGPEGLRELFGGALAEVVAEVESLEGSVTSVSGAGLVALFGAPVAHEDDPERALRAAYRSLAAVKLRSAGLSVRAGVETGPAVVGPLLGGGHYGAFGEVVTTAAALESVARPASVLVGPVTRAITEGLFEWGPTEEVAPSSGSKPIRAGYVERPRARPSSPGGRRPAGRVPLVGREAELSLLRDALRDATAGKGGVVLIAGEPGLGKTRLVQECRKLFVAWVGAASGRLPLWLEGRAASYAASHPYGLYQQLLSAWVGVGPEESEAVVRAGLESGLKAVFGADAGDELAGLLSMVMGIGPGKSATALGRLSPEQLQRATFDAMRAVFARLVGHGPTVLVLEDLHWADPTSLRLTEEVSSVTKEGPLLLVLTRRPEPDPGSQHSRPHWGPTRASGCDGSSQPP